MAAEQGQLGQGLSLTDLLAQRSVPLLTPELPGTSGLVRVAEDDFYVEELPLYEASGAGEHLYLTVEKRGRSTVEVAGEIARNLGARERDVGTAGLKDKRAVSVQRISVLSKATPEEALRLQGRGFRVLAAARHGNKLRPGHLRGNRFRSVVRGVVPEAEVVREDALADQAGQPAEENARRDEGGTAHCGLRIADCGGLRIADC